MFEHSQGERESAHRVFMFEHSLFPLREHRVFTFEHRLDTVWTQFEQSVFSVHTECSRLNTLRERGRASERESGPARPRRHHPAGPFPRPPATNTRSLLQDTHTNTAGETRPAAAPGATKSPRRVCAHAKRSKLDSCRPAARAAWRIHGPGRGPSPDCLDRARGSLQRRNSRRADSRRPPRL